MDGFYDQKYNMSSDDQSSYIEPGATFGEYVSTNESLGELGNLDSYKNNVVTKLSPVTIGAYPTSSSFCNFDFNGIESTSSTSNYNDSANVNTFQDLDLNTNSYENNGTYINMEPTASILPQVYNGYDTTTSNNIDYQMGSNINGNDFPIVSDYNTISSDNIQSAGSDSQYNELFNSKELGSSQNYDNEAYLSSYRNNIPNLNILEEDFKNSTLDSNNNYDEGQYVISYQPDYNSKNWSDIGTTNDNVYESQNFNTDSNEQIPLYNLNASISNNDYKFESNNYQVENNYFNTSDYANSNDNLGEVYPSTGAIKSYSVHSQPIYTKPKHTSFTLPPRVMFPKDEVDYIPVKKTKYIKKTKTKVFIPTKKTIVIPKITKVIIPKKKIIYVQSPNKYSNSTTVLPPRVSTTYVQNSYTSPVRSAYQRNNIIDVTKTHNVTTTSLSPVRYNITSLPVVTSPATNYGYSSPINNYNSTTIPETTYKVDSIPVTNYNTTTSIPETAYNVDTYPATNYNVSSIPSSNYQVASIPLNNNIATSSNTYNVEPTPVTNYSVTSIPKDSYNVTTSPLPNYNVTSIPSNNYDVTSYPVNNYNVTSIPKNSYNITSIPVNNYNVTSIPVNSYNITSYKNYDTPSIPVKSYKVDSIRVSNYNATSFPSNNYNITSIPKYKKTSNYIYSTPTRKYGVASNRYSTYSIRSYNVGSNPVSPLRASREIEIARVVTPLRTRSFYKNRIYHVDTLSSQRYSRRHII